MNKPPVICDVEDLCNAVGCTLDDQETAQMKIEGILNYLVEWHVIDKYDADQLDWVFGDEETN